MNINPYGYASPQAPRAPQAPLDPGLNPMKQALAQALFGGQGGGMDPGGASPTGNYQMPAAFTAGGGGMTMPTASSRDYAGEIAQQHAKAKMAERMLAMKPEGSGPLQALAQALGGYMGSRNLTRATNAEADISKAQKNEEEKKYQALAKQLGLDTSGITDLPSLQAAATIQQQQWTQRQPKYQVVGPDSTAVDTRGIGPNIVGPKRAVAPRRPVNTPEGLVDPDTGELVRPYSGYRTPEQKAAINAEAAASTADARANAKIGAQFKLDRKNAPIVEQKTKAFMDLINNPSFDGSVGMIDQYTAKIGAQRGTKEGILSRRAEMLANQLVLDSGQLMKGSFSNKDIEFLQSTAPKPGDGPEVWRDWFNNTYMPKVNAAREAQGSPPLNYHAGPATDETKTNSAPPMTALPSASDHPGRIIKGSDGSLLKSDGTSWQPAR